MRIKDRYNVKIEKMVNGGRSLARVEGIPVFAAGGCPLDIVEIEITKVNKNFAEAKITNIIEPSIYREKSICPYSKECGSCDWLYMNYSEQLNQKENIVRETLKNITGCEYQTEKIISSPKIKEYRCKIQLPVSQTKVSKRLLSGYYKKNSHELINIKYCPMQKDYINELAEFIKEEAQLLKIDAYDENKRSGTLRHILIRHSSDYNEILIVLVVNNTKSDKILYKLAKSIKEKYPKVRGVCINYNSGNTNVILGEKTKCITGENFYTERLCGKTYKISAGSFFQINPYCAELLFNKIEEIITSRIEKPVILDAYSGVSAIGIRLAEISEKVISVEEVKEAAECAKENAIINSVNNIEIINSDASDAFEKLLKNDVSIDVSVTDPPRKGCSPASVKYLSLLTKKYIIYVSCNISTLARDINLFKEYNFIPVLIQPVDMFPNTYHIETIALLEKQNKKEA